MQSTSERWKEVTPSQFPWEREALAFVRERLGDHDPYRAWSNFELIADNGAIDEVDLEVDLLVVSPKGFFLVEIKGQLGELRGDAGTWIWTRNDGSKRTDDTPLLLANRKATTPDALRALQPVAPARKGTKQATKKTAAKKKAAVPEPAS